MILSKEQILASNDQKTQKVETPEWGGFVYVKTMRSIDRDQYEREVQGGIPENIRAKLAVKTICDEQGNLLFDQTDIDALGKKSASALDRIVGVAMKMNSFSPEDIKDLEGN